MRSTTKMMMLTGGNGMNNRGGRTGMEMREEPEMYGGMAYSSMDDMEARRRYRRDSRGRFRSEMDGGDMRMEDDMESRRRYGRSAMEDYERSERGNDGRPFPVYEDGRSNMNLIGFNPNREIETSYRMNATHHTGNEMESRGGSKMGGNAYSSMTAPLTKRVAEEWTHHMKNSDGTRGPHWDMEKAKRIMNERKIDCDFYEFYAILNAVYSDYCKTFEKHGIDSQDLYVDLACAWLKDEDAWPNKAALYYDCIVKK